MCIFQIVAAKFFYLVLYLKASHPVSRDLNWARNGMFTVFCIYNHIKAYENELKQCHDVFLWLSLK